MQDHKNKDKIKETFEIAGNINQCREYINKKVSLMIS